MNSKLKILHLEDLPSDAQLISKVLKRGKIDCEILVVDTKEKYINVLHEFNPDVILSDHCLPSFNSIEALSLAREVNRKIPFILVTATVSEEFAVEVIKKGVDDYILKDRLTRLPNAISNVTEKYRLENEQQKSLENIINNEKRFRALIENGEDAIIILNIEGRPTYVSPSVHRLLGYTEEETKCIVMGDNIHPDDRAHVAKIMAECLAKPGVPVKGGVARVAHKNGTWVSMDATLTNMLHDPAINGIVDNFRDVTENILAEEKLIHANRMLINDVSQRKQAEQALRESKSNLQAIFDNSPEGFILADTKGFIKTYNNKAKDRIKLNTDQEIKAGTSIFDYIQESRKDNYKGSISKVLAGEILHYDYPYTRKNGEIKWFNFIVSPVYEHNIITGFSMSSVDITQRKEAEQQLQESELFNKEILASLSSHIAVISNNGTIIAVNKAWDDFAKANGATVLERVSTGSNYFEVCEKAIAAGDITAAQALQGIKAVFNKECQSFKLEYPCDSPDEQRWFTVHVSNFGVEGCKIVISHQDITERKKSEEQVIVSRANLNAVIENTDAIIYSLDTDYNYITFNSGLKKTMKELYGIDVKQGDNVFTFMRPFDPVQADDWEAIYSKAFKGEVVKFEKEFKLNDFYSYTSFSIHPIWEDKNVIGLSCFVSDITKQKQTSDALMRSEFQYRRIVETAQEGIWLLDENNLTTFVNKKMCEILEYSEEEMMGKENVYFMDDAGKKDAAATMERRIKGVAEFIELRFITKSGKHIWTNISANPILDDKGNYKGALGMITNITEKKNLEDLLNKTNNLARIGNYELNLKGNYLYWSGVTKQIHEVDAGFVPNVETAINFYKAGTSRETITRAVQEAIEKNIPFDLELQIVTAKGNDKWVRVIGEAECYEDKCIRLYGSFQDIDAGKKAEGEVLKAYEEKNTILESIGDAFFAVDKRWVVTYWNKVAEKILFGPKNQIIGKNLWDVFSDSINSESFLKYSLAIDNNEVVNFEDYYKPLDKWFEISAYPSPNGLSVFFKDITERKHSQILLTEINNNLEKTAKELAFSNAELEQFAYVASHDLQEPLRMITSFLTLLEKKYKDKLDHKGKQYIDFAVDGGKRMRQIILDLLEFSRIGRTEDTLEKVDLNELINEILSLQSQQIKDVKAKVHVDKLPALNSYKAPLRQVFQNLINNGLKYHKDGVPPHIYISVNDDDKFWRFAVTDNGIGIEAAYLNKIFIIFQRLHNKEKYTGTGIGLAITKKIIESMGGKIWVESQEGTGSTFLFTLKKITT